jgi:hypothetical protein
MDFVFDICNTKVMPLTFLGAHDGRGTQPAQRVIVGPPLATTSHYSGLTFNLDAYVVEYVGHNH